MLRHITSSRIIGTNGLSIEFCELEISVLLKIRMPLICMTVEIKGLPGRDSRTGGYLVSPTLNHGMKKIDPLKMRRSELKSVNYCQNYYFCSGKCKEDTAILASVIFH